VATKREIEVAGHLRDMFIMAWPTRRDFPSPEEWGRQFDQHTTALLNFVSQIGLERDELAEDAPTPR
jgi:hypothetical protein